MVKKNKLINGVDDKTWNRFSGFCKTESLLMGPTMTNILKEFLKKKSTRGQK